MVKANNSRIEETATTVLKTTLLRCSILQSYIDTNDKTPSWDGNVFVYKNGAQKKEDFLGKVPIQVKGTEKKISGKTAPYSCKVVDLQNYYKDGGCVFFLVSVNPSTGKSTIFYLSLLVYDLKKLIDKAKKQKTITIYLKRFPTNDTNEIASVFISFVENARKQTGFIGKDLVTLEQLKKQGIEIDKLTFNTSGIGLNLMNIGNFITTHDFYLYAKPKGLDIEIPVDKISNAIVSRPVIGNVIVNGTKYYSSYSIVSQKGQSLLKLGKSITIMINDTHHKLTINFKPNGTLSDFIRDGECFVAIAEHKKLVINGANMPLEGLTEIDLSQYKDSLKYYKDVKRMLEVLGVTEELQCDKLTERDETNIRNFVGAILYNKKIIFSGMEETTIYGALKIANLSIWIWAIKQEEGYHIESFFCPRQMVFFENTDIEKKNPVSASQYLLLSKEALINTSNMDYDKVEEDLSKLKYNPLLVDIVVAFLLNVLNAYDEQISKDNRLLEIADIICEWLLCYENAIDSRILRLNQLQIIKRRRKFNIQEKIELGKLLDDSCEPIIKCGAYLLLEEIDEAQKCFNSLAPKAQKEFITFPICHFGKLIMEAKINE